jgi:hypothetical protein
MRCSGRFLSVGAVRYARRLKLGGDVWFLLMLPFVVRSRGRIYVASRPDSDFTHHEHPELAALAEIWAKHNRKNRSDLPRLYAIAFNIKQVMSKKIPGDYAELGVFSGNSGAVLAYYARQHRRSVFNKGQDFTATSLDTVCEVVGDSAAIYVNGWFPGTVTGDMEARRYAVVHWGRAGG